MKGSAAVLLSVMQLASTPAFAPQNSGVAVRLRGISAVSAQVAWARGADVSRAAAGPLYPWLFSVVPSVCS